MKNIVDIFFETDENIELGEKIKNLTERALTAINPSFPTSVTITFTDNENIREINKDQRNIDKSTDVLSFPMLFWDKPEILSSKLTAADYDMESGCVTLGDIIISVEKAREQAEEYGHSFDREITYLAVHGLLHLFGYDHMTDADKQIMRAKEEETLKM